MRKAHFSKLNKQTPDFQLHITEHQIFQTSNFNLKSSSTLFFKSFVEKKVIIPLSVKFIKPLNVKRGICNIAGFSEDIINIFGEYFFDKSSGIKEKSLSSISW